MSFLSCFTHVEYYSGDMNKWHVMIFRKPFMMAVYSLKAINKFCHIVKTCIFYCHHDITKGFTCTSEFHRWKLTTVNLTTLNLYVASTHLKAEWCNLRRLLLIKYGVPNGPKKPIRANPYRCFWPISYTIIKKFVSNSLMQYIVKLWEK